jgi:hypothetical protein
MTYESNAVRFTLAMGTRLTMRLSDAGLHQRRTKALYPNHRLPPWLTEDATRDRSNRLLGADLAATRIVQPIIAMATEIISLKWAPPQFDRRLAAMWAGKDVKMAISNPYHTDNRDKRDVNKIREGPEDS